LRRSRSQSSPAEKSILHRAKNVVAREGYQRPPTEAAFHANTIINPIPIRVFTPANRHAETKIGREVFRPEPDLSAGHWDFPIQRPVQIHHARSGIPFRRNRTMNLRTTAAPELVHDRRTTGVEMHNAALAEHEPALHSAPRASPKRIVNAQSRPISQIGGHNNVIPEPS
jgi:hypothetical protein